MFGFCWHDWRVEKVFSLGDYDWCFIVHGMKCQRCQKKKLKHMDKDYCVSSRVQRQAYAWLNEQQPVKPVKLRAVK